MHISVLTARKDPTTTGRLEKTGYVPVLKAIALMPPAEALMSVVGTLGWKTDIRVGNKADILAHNQADILSADIQETEYRMGSF